ncbi:MAG: tyrosine-type recombinase/integrase [Clostridiales bacterium]|nr:tyrosine-type recombinase/integrase [Clostridiales bacterium]
MVDALRITDTITGVNEVNFHVKMIYIKSVKEHYKEKTKSANKHLTHTEAALDKRIKIYASKAHESCKDVPLKAHAHLFRHAKASHWIEDGLSVVEVQFLLGHEQIETTMKYLDITTEEKVKALATLESETDKKVSRKWKKGDGSLTDFCSLKR